MHEVLKSTRITLIGALSFLSFAPYGITSILICTIAWFYIAVSSKKFSLKHSYMFGFGYHISLLYWLYNPILLDRSISIYLSFLAPICASMFLSLSFIVVYKLLHRSGKTPFLFALMCTFSEYFICEILTKLIFGSGFPWCYAGYSLYNSIYISQLASIFGIYGLSFFVYYIAANIGEFILYKNPKRLSIAILSFMLSFLYGLVYTQISITKQIPSALLVQPNISKQDKWSFNKFFITLSSLKKLSSTEKPLIIWPESCLPYILTEDNHIIPHLASFLNNDQFLILGITRKNNEGNFFNSLIVINSVGDVISIYNKNILVPFGEFIPLKKLFTLPGLIGDRNEYSPGKSRDPILVNKTHKFLPLICYEIIFPNLNQSNADFVINLTNDVWFGNSTAPYQHLAIARIRAIEMRCPILRVANTGISAVINQYGQLIKTLELNTHGSLSL